MSRRISDVHLHHTEQHFTSGDRIRDIVIGMSDGLTVPFALAAGISGAVASTHLVVTAGLAEVAAGSIAMGLGGYLAARGDAEHYASEERREREEVRDKSDVERAEVAQVLAGYGVSEEASRPVVEELARNPDQWVQFMMRFELGLEKPDPSRALTSALTIGASYIVGGLFPLAPYIILGQPRPALIASVVLTLAALAVFGFVKGRFSGQNAIKSAIQTVVIGGLAAAAAFGLARAFSG